MIILFFVTLVGVTGVHITELSVPRLIRNGTQDYVTLDCDYHIEEAEKSGLVVKWFLDESPVYQWIPNQKPQDLGILRGRLNLDYQASKDVYKMHRALQIREPSINLSGTYLCRVSTFYGEAFKAANMIVFAPEKDMGIKVEDSPNKQLGQINVSCWASGIFPEPRLTLYQGENKEVKIDDVLVMTKWNQGTFDIKAHKVLDEANLSTIMPSVFDCELSIPRTDYAVRRSAYYEPGSLEVRGRLMANGVKSSTSGVSSGTALVLKLIPVIAIVIFQNWWGVLQHNMES